MKKLFCDECGKECKTVIRQIGLNGKKHEWIFAYSVREAKVISNSPSSSCVSYPTPLQQLADSKEGTVVVKVDVGEPNICFDCVMALLKKAKLPKKEKEGK